jgi:predicted porin
MNNPLTVLALAGALAGSAQAQSGVSLHGALDAGLLARAGAALSIGKRDASAPGFKGVAELGPGLKVLFELDIGFEPDVGTPDSGTRPRYRADGAASANPFSISTSCRARAWGGLAGHERDESAWWSAAASAWPLTALRLTASYADRGHTPMADESTSAWVVGANYSVATGTLLLGYGRLAPDGAPGTRLWSLGYAYPLSRRAYVYANASDQNAASSVPHVDLGLRASF